MTAIERVDTILAADKSYAWHLLRSSAILSVGLVGLGLLDRHAKVNRLITVLVLTPITVGVAGFPIAHKYLREGLLEETREIEKQVEALQKKREILKRRRNSGEKR